MIPIWVAILLVVTCLIFVYLYLTKRSDCRFYRKEIVSCSKTCDELIRLNKDLLKDLNEYAEEIDDLYELLDKKREESTDA